ncbi:FtsK/SpoIIIE domain-containing protein [Streptomyces sp. NPDC047028]|uniref:FtsK/SpoIIIE domain-containing protein n=1 Tax=Streptomyces sp. NPDC047028 TaxID=3155793 RepID=UPI0033CF99A6
MQIRLTVVDPLGPSPQRGRAASRDVLVTAPTGTDLAAVASALASAVTGDAGAGRESSGAAVVLYAGAERLDARRCVLGEPPLVDGAVLALGAPAAPEPHPELDDAPTQLHVVAGPDAGGVHLLHGGRVTVGRSAEADVPLDDPDVSRLHCAVTVSTDGRVAVADLNSTNGTVLAGARVGDHPVRFPAGALLRVGESTLRLTPSGGPGARILGVPDGEGCVRVGAETAEAPGGDMDARAAEAIGGPGPAGSAGGGHARVERGAGAGAAGAGGVPYGYDREGSGAAGAGGGHHAYGGDGGRGGREAAAASGGQEHRRTARPVVPEQAGAPGIENRGPRGAAEGVDPEGGDTHGGRFGVAGGPARTAAEEGGRAPDGRKGTPLRGTDVPPGVRRRGGLGAWARRLAGGRGEQPAAVPEAFGEEGGGAAGAPVAGVPQQPEAWPDPAAVLLTALGPGPRLWERTPGHPETLTVRLGTADRSAPDGSGLLPAVPVTAGLREAGALGLAGPRPRLSGLARAVLAQLAALHSPDQLEIVLISADRARPVAERTAEWSWLGWLPHVRPAHGQDCRLLLAYDREQAAARAEELLRRVEAHAATGRTAAHPGPSRLPAPSSPAGRSGGRPSDDGQSPAGHITPADAAPRSVHPTPPPHTLSGTGRPGHGAAEGSAPQDGRTGAAWSTGPASPATGAPAGLRHQDHGPADHSTPPGGRGNPSAGRTADAAPPAPGVPGPWAGPGHEGYAGREDHAGAEGAPGAEDTARPGRGAESVRRTGPGTGEPGGAGRSGHMGAEGGAPPRGTTGHGAAGHSAADRGGPSVPGGPGGAAVDWAGPTGVAGGAEGPSRAGASAPGGSPSGGSVEHARSATGAGASAVPDQAGGDAWAAPGPGAGPAGRGGAGFAVPDDGGRRPSWARADAGVDGGGGFSGPYTVVVVDGDPGGGALRDVLGRLAVAGPRAGVHVLCLAETAPSSPDSPVAQTYEAACAVVPTFRHCGAVALLGGDVATALHLMRVAPSGLLGPGTLASVDAVSGAWAERVARALAPLRPDGAPGERHARVAAPLPQSARLLDELGLARATPASLMARWADAGDDTESLGGRAWAVLGAGAHGPLVADLVAEGPHLLIEGPPGSGRTELLRAVVASLAAAERPDRLGMVLIDGRDGIGAGAGRGGEGLRVCTDIPHVTTHLIANDPVRMREFAQSLSAELKRRAELLGRSDFAQWHAGREVSGRIVAQRRPVGRPGTAAGDGAGAVGGADGTGALDGGVAGAGDLEAAPSSTMRLRPGAAARRSAAVVPPLPRLVVVADDLDALVSPALGSPGRPAAGSVLRALEAVARDGARLGVHLVAAAGVGGRTAETEPARRATLRVVLDAPASGPDEPAPGRGRLAHADGRQSGFQSGRVTGRIPRTATQRPTVVPLEWQRMGDPPTRRPVRELGNGPTDLALLASAVERAAREVSATTAASLL